MTRPEFVTANAACIGAYWMADILPSDTYGIRAARVVCSTCPVLAECRQWALTNDVAGVVAGLTDADRDDARARRHIRVEPTPLSDVIRARDLTTDMVDDLPVMQGKRFHPAVIDVVLRMTYAGMAAQDIVDVLQHPQLTLASKVDYIRRKYMKGHSHVEV